MFPWSLKMSEEQQKVEQAFKEGAYIEYRSKLCTTWFQAEKPTFNWEDCDYRISDRQPWNKS